MHQPLSTEPQPPGNLPATRLHTKTNNNYMFLRSIQFESDVGLGRVALAAFGLGFILAVHLCLFLGLVFAREATRNVMSDDRWECLVLWTVYVLALSFFHLMEFLLTASYRPAIVSYESFLLNHSREYHLAVCMSMVEFWLEFIFAPDWKISGSLHVVGLVIVALGQGFRIAAMATAASNFSHRIESMKRKEHVLVTHGVYRYIRHPSYLGWFAWIVGSQLFLANPVCLVGYTIVGWGFFKDRIPYEEMLLMDFFPDEYPQYKARSISGIPFV